MVRKKRILVIPHIGTALGHFIRTAEYINYRYYNSSNDIYIALPESLYIRCKHHLPINIKVVKRKILYTVTSDTGDLDEVNYKKLINENEEMLLKIKPDLIIGDPGIQASILGSKYNIEWIGIMHGLYLPKPELDFNDDICKELFDLSWRVANTAFDMLIKIGTNSRFNSWADIRKTGSVVILNKYEYEPSVIGDYVQPSFAKIGWNEGSPVELLITCCSSGTVIPSTSFLKNIVNYYEKITIAGAKQSHDFSISKIENVGNNFNYASLIGDQTTVITHGGHGSLKSIVGAKRVIMIAGDIDQLYNSLIANATRSWEIVFDKDWLQILNSNNPFKRYINWDNIKLCKEQDILKFLGEDFYVKV